MNKSESITKVAAALVKAQSEMSNAKKGATNPFFKSKYADLNSIREAALPVLNAHGITIIQPTCVLDGVNYVETILLHESGEYISSLTQIVVDKMNDAQKHGSGLSYARRYALQSIVCLGAEDDDANAAVKPSMPQKEVVTADQAKTMINAVTDVDVIAAVYKSLPKELQKDKSIIAHCAAKKQELLNLNSEGAE
jgi:hypothetical protein